MNKVILVGRLARDPEVRYTQSGKAWARMTIAVDRRLGRNAQDQQQTADFIPLIAWDKLAEVCGNNLHKGSKILAEGRIQVRSYDAQDGAKRYATEVVMNEMEFMDKKSAGPSAATASAPADQQTQLGQPISDDDVPF